MSVPTPPNPFAAHVSSGLPILTHRTIHHGRKFDFEMVRIERAGRKPIDREMVRHPGAVVVVPILPDGRIVLIRNTRWALSSKHADGTSSGPEVLWECCAGTIEKLPGGGTEDPALCAPRELIEETGYRAGKLTSLGWFYTTPGMTDERMHAFAATDLVHVGQKLEEDESIQVESLTVARVWEMIDSGELRDAKSMLAIMLAARRGLLPQ